MRVECGEQEQMRSQKGSGEQTWEQLATQEVPMTNSETVVVMVVVVGERLTEEKKGFRGRRWSIDRLSTDR